MGEVYRVWDRVLEREVALKLIRADAPDAHTMQARFLTEARVGAQLQHPGVAPLYDLGVLRDGQSYFTMKEIHGRDLSSLIDEASAAGELRATQRRLLEIFRRACETIAYAHSQGFLHRDLKPSNIMVAEHGEVLVIDWGLACRRAEAGCGVAGTPGFMSPEQADPTQPTGPEADVFALGVTLGQLLTGRSPDAPIAAQVGLDDGLTAIHERATRGAPAERYPDAGALVEAVDAWLAGARRREKAAALLSDADSAQARRREVLRHSEALRAEAAALMQEDWISAAGWERWEQSREALGDAEALALERLAAFQAALLVEPDTPTARTALARHLARQALRDERDGRWRAAELLWRQREAHLQALSPAERRRQEDASRQLQGLQRRCLERGTFIGRGALLEQLTATLSDAGVRLCTLVGPPGVGKTRLALELATSHAGLSAAEVVFCDASSAVSDVELRYVVADALAVLLTSSAPEKQLRNALRGRGRLLLVLDNLEQLAASAREAIQGWLPEAPELTVLATSRRALAVDSETVEVLAPLSGLDAVALFVERGRRVRPGLKTGPASRALLGEVVDRLDRLPLALELVAARLADFPLPELVKRLEDRFGYASARRRDVADPRHQTLLGAIAWSWDQLPPSARAALAQASVFRGGFDREAAEAVIAPSTDAPLIDDLNALVADNLLLRQIHAGEVRYNLLESIREFAARALSDFDRESASRKHAEHYAALDSELRDVRDVKAHLRRRRRELQNLVAAARGRRDAWGIRCGLAACKVFDIKGPFSEGLTLVDRLMVEASPGPVLRGRLLNTSGQLRRRAGELDVAQRHHSEALAIFEAEGAEHLRAQTIAELGNNALQRGATDEAAALLLDAQATYRRRGDLNGEACVLSSLGLLYQDQGRTTDAEAAYTRCIAIATERGDDIKLAINLGNLGNLHQELGRPVEAEASYRQSLSLHRAQGARQQVGTVLGNMANLFMSIGELDEATRHHEMALEIHRHSGNQQQEGRVLANLGALHCRRGQLEDGRRYMERALEVHRASGNRRSEGLTLGNLGGLSAALKQYDLAETYFLASLAIQKAIDSPRGQGITLTHLGTLAFERGALDDAEAYLDRAMDALLRTDEPLSRALVHLNRGHIAQARGDLSGARAELSIALESLHAIGAVHYEGITLRHLGNLEREAGAPARARVLLRRGLEALRRAAADRERCEILADLAALHLEQGELPAAREALTEGEEALVSIGGDAALQATLAGLLSDLQKSDQFSNADG